MVKLRHDKMSGPGFAIKSSVFSLQGLPCGSGAKESTCNVGGLGLIPGLGRSPGEWKGSHSRILAWESHELCRPWSSKVLDMTEDSHFTSLAGPFPLRRGVPQGNRLKLSLWCSKRFYTLKHCIVPRFRFDEGHGFLFSRKGRKWEMEKNLKNALKAQSQAGQL